nr:hypothetical protein [Pedobacter kyonggii]
MSENFVIIPKTDKIILYSLFSLPLIFLIVVFFSGLFGKTRKELMLEDCLSENFTGRVDSLFWDKQNHNVKTAILSNGYRYQIFPNWELKIKHGDSLSKKIKTLHVELFRNHKRVDVLDYNQQINNLIE